MNKQDLRYAYLNYFKNQFMKNELIESKTLLEMAPNGKIAKDVINELVQEGLVEGIYFVDGKEKSLSLDLHEVVNLTEKGRDEINKMVSTQKHTEDINKEEQAEKLLQKIITKERERIAKLSPLKKEEELKTKILEYFNFLFLDIDKYKNKQIKVKELKENIKRIVADYFVSTPQIYAKRITQNLISEGYITYLYQKDSTGLVDIDKLLTNKAKNFINKLEEEKKQEIEEYCKNNDIKFSQVNIPIEFIQSYEKICNYPAIIKAIEQSSILAKHIYSNLPSFEHNSIQMAIEVAKNIPTIAAFNYIQQNKEYNINDETNKTYIFEGILGQNCGEVVTPTSEDIKRIQQKGFKVENGITVLRGFAKSSTIAAASQADNNYQRDKNLKHINALTEFMKKMKTSAKYLPEVTLVARGYNSLQPIAISGNLNETQKGEIENLEYYRLSVNKDQLYRIDGNHRLEAIKYDNYYIPFSIIVWDKSSISEDDEAFLFYFLNSKSKKLTSEENLKGLVNAKNWTDYELETANVILPYIKYFKENYEGHTLFNKEYYKNSQGVENAKTQILNVLELILKESDKDCLSFDKKTFGDYINKSQEILSQRDRFKYLREHFRCFPQFVFYTLYQNKGDTEKSIRFINEVNKWAEHYKHDSNSFIQPNKMFHNASKQLERKINIFVAMPYYDKTTVEQFNKTLESLVEEMKQEDELLKDKLNLYPIMIYKAESTDILTNMDKQIGECDIFIADISNHGKNKVNPNVMFELGRVYDKKKFLLIRNKDNKDSDSAFDIKHFDFIPIDYGMGFDTSMKENLKPRIMNIIKNIIGFC